MPSTRSAGRPRSAATDAAILDAALELLIERGVADTSIEQVAKRAGVTRATIYRRFRGKVELLGAAIEAAYGNPQDIPEIRDIEHLLTGWSQVLSDPRQRKLLRRLYSCIDDFPELAQAYRATRRTPTDDARRDVLAGARARSLFPRDADVDVILRMLEGAVWLHLVAYPDTSTSRDIRRFLAAVLHEAGYRPERGNRRGNAKRRS